MKYVFLAIYIIATCLHLFACIKYNPKLRNITKGFILAGLIGFYIFATKTIFPSVIIALVFSLLGDLFLISHKTKFFIIGGISFMLSHFFYIISYCLTESIACNGVGKVIVLLYLIIFAITAYNFRNDKLSGGIICYLAVNMLMNTVCLARFCTEPTTLNFIGVIGAGLFYTSDVVLFTKRNPKLPISIMEFIVMITYSVGQLLLVLSFLN